MEEPHQLLEVEDLVWDDLPLLRQVTHPVAVDPDDTLAAHAREQDWKIISLRE